MPTRALAMALTVFVTATSGAEAGSPPGPRPVAPTRTIGTTVIEGHSDPVLWDRVLGLLPAPPARIIIVDLDTLPPAARQRVKGLEAFVLAGNPAVFVVGQGSTLQSAARGDRLDMIALASIIWHEMAHLDGLDEAGAICREQELWHRWRRTGRVDGELALTYIARLDYVKSRRTR